MKTALIRIGNSRGIRIPKILLEQYRFNDEVELEPRHDHLVIRPTTQARDGWDDSFRQMRERGDDALLDEESLSATQWDTAEWEW
jgi:antitoxin MazE